METVFQQAVESQQAGRHEEAEGLYRRIVDWQPARVLGNLGVLLRITGRLDEAEGVLREALAVEPERLGAQHTLAMTLLQLGRYDEGWPLYEVRHRILPRATRDLPEWRGEPLRGKRLLVLGEQGYGDQILWLRFLPLLAGLGAEVVLAVDTPLIRLCRQLPVRVLQGPGWRTLPADAWVSLGSVPRWLGAGPADAPTPYLAATPSEAGDGVGLMLEGGRGNPNPDRIPDPAAQQAIRALTGFRDLAPAASGARDFADTASLVGGLERVVSVDTAVAHLAGAMGAPCTLLLPRPAHDWYTRWDDDRTPWHPSLRTVRQTRAGAWGDVIAALAATLKPDRAADAGR